MSWLENTLKNYTLQSSLDKIREIQIKQSSPFEIIGVAGTRLWGVDPGIILSQHATVARPPLHILLLLTHHTLLFLFHIKKIVFGLFKSVNFNSRQFFKEHAWTGMQEYFCYFVVQGPCLIVTVHASPAKKTLVVNLDQLPLWTVAEVSKKTARRLKEIPDFQQKPCQDVEIHFLKSVCLTCRSEFCSKKKTPSILKVDENTHI